MSVKDELTRLTPRLRRYARALAQASPAPSDSADALVHATFLRILDCGLPDRTSELVLQVFALLTELHRDTVHERPIAPVSGGTAYVARGGEIRAGQRNPQPKAICSALAGLRLDEREALLLVVVEGFSYAQAARILHISRSHLLGRLSRARARLAEALNTEAAASGRRIAHLRIVK